MGKVVVVDSCGPVFDASILIHPSDAASHVKHSIPDHYDERAEQVYHPRTVG